MVAGKIAQRIKWGTIGLVFMGISAFAGQVYYVDNDSPGGSGLSWAEAFNSLSIALDAAISGDEIRVAQGTYRPTSPGGDRTISFIVPDGVTLLGGYPGAGADDPDRRDVGANRTILTGDLNGNDVLPMYPGHLLDVPSRQDNSFHVVRTEYVYPSGITTIGGFYITGGNANGDHYTQHDGGGVDVGGHSVWIRDCEIIANSAMGSGGGVSGGNLSNCRIRFNYAKWSGGGVQFPRSMDSCMIEGNISEMGGGMCGALNETVYTQCDFLFNDANFGGAVYLNNHLAAFERCDFIGNWADSSGGACSIINDCTCLSELKMFRCRMTDNYSGGRGGAIYHEGNPRVLLYSCLLERNHATVFGGAIYSLTYEGMRDMGYLGVTNCTIVDNEAGQQTGGLWSCSANKEYLDVVNAIMWGNRDLSGVGQQDGQIWISTDCNQQGTGGTLVPTGSVVSDPVRYCCIEGLTEGFGGEGNIGADPLFMAWGSDAAIPNNFRLTAESPCINAGTNAAYPCFGSQPNPGTGTWVDPTDPTCSAGLTDLDGVPRIRGGIVDMGAYELQTAVGAILYVDDTAQGLNDGSSWGDAFTKLQNALTAFKPGNEIRVAQGVYRPADPNGSRDASFILRDGMVLRGGFAGFGAPKPDDRDPVRFESILDGQRAYHVVVTNGTGRTTVLDGFTIRGGDAWNTDDGYLTEGSYGGGLYNKEGSPTIRHCRFMDNQALAYGGGMYSESGDPLILDCQFFDNSATDGGGLDVDFGGAVVQRCIFSGNRACSYNADGGTAGAIYCFKSQCRIEHCVVVGNGVDEWGFVAGIKSNDAEVRVAHCILWNNRDHDTGGWALQFDGPMTVVFSCVEGLPEEFESTGNIDDDPLFADSGQWLGIDEQFGSDCTANTDYQWQHGDYHLKSQAGRWDANAKSWVQDDITSPCIDAGNPAAAIMFEPFPNGGVINMGPYGGTAEASKSWFGKPVCAVIVAGDINGDCKVDLGDFAILVGHWLEAY